MKSAFFGGVFIGVMAALYLGGMIVAATYPKFQNTINECRAANPGYDCSPGYIKSEPF